MGRITLKSQYFSWLYLQIRGPGKSRYEKLCRQLHSKKFTWNVLNDDNRCEDGIGLRDIFTEENNLDEAHIEVRYFLKGDCTVFEMLVALAKRIEYQTEDVGVFKIHTHKWFQEMISNLGLGEFTDDIAPDDRFTPVTEAEIDDALEKLVSRNYDFYGRGGLFPLKRRPPKDQTDVEIWYQLMLYLDENYGL